MHSAGAALIVASVAAAVVLGAWTFWAVATEVAAFAVRRYLRDHPPLPPSSADDQGAGE